MQVLRQFRFVAAAALVLMAVSAFYMGWRYGFTRPRRNYSELAIRNLQPVQLQDSFAPLSQTTIDGVQKFVLFVGYPGSGHSIIGSVMDAHPNMIISHEYTALVQLLKRPELADKATLFNDIYRDSYMDATRGWRSSMSSRKGYNLGVGSKWQAKFTKLKVIGDKSGGQTTRLFYQHPDDFDRAYRQLKQTIGIPLHIIHVVRNPYDMAATDTLYMVSNFSHGVKLKGASKGSPYNNTKKLKIHIGHMATRARMVMQILLKYNMTVLEIHNSGFILHPRATLQRICDFLDLECPQEYLQECKEKQKGFTEVSKTRFSVVWSPEALTMVEQIIHIYPFFRRYSFDSN